MPESDIKLKDISVSRNHAFIKIMREDNQVKMIL